MAGTLDAVALALPTLRELSEILRFLVWLALVVLLGGILKGVYENAVGSADDSTAGEPNETASVDESNEPSDTTADTNTDSVTE